MKPTNEITTASGHLFHGCGFIDKKQCLFSVSPDISAADALDSAFCLLDSVKEALFNAGMGKPLEGNPAWLAYHALESAQAVVAAVADGLDAGAGQGSAT